MAVGEVGMGSHLESLNLSLDSSTSFVLEEGAEDTLGERLVLPSDVFPVEVSKLKIIQNT